MGIAVLRNSFWICYRVLLGGCLLAGAILRINGVSAIYLLLLLIGAAVSFCEGRGTGNLGIALTALIVSVCSFLGQALFQISLAMDYSIRLRNCSGTQWAWHQFGFNLMEEFQYDDYLRYLLPDIFVFATSLVSVILAINLKRRQQRKDESDGKGHRPRKLSPQAIRNYLFTLGLFGAVIFLPSILASIYFILLMSIGIVWSIRLTFPKLMQIMKLITFVYAAVHLFAIYAYQFYSVQTAFDPKDRWTKFLGFSAISNATSCHSNRPWEFSFGDDLIWRDIVNAVAVLFLYFVSATEVHLLDLQPKPTSATFGMSSSWWTQTSRIKHSRGNGRNLKESDESESLELLDEGEDERKRYKSLEPVTEPVAISQEETSVNEMDQEQSIGFSSGSGENDPDKPISLKDKFLLWWKDITGIVRFHSWHISILAALIWSIVFLSWTSFVLLVWACIVWMVKESRTACFYSMPVLIIYTMALSVGQFIYSLEDVDKVLEDHKWEGFTADWAYLFPVQIVFEWIFFLTLREFIKVRQLENKGEHPVKMKFETLTRHIQPRASSPAKETLARVLELVYEFVNDYWVLLCYGAFLLVSLSIHVSLMRGVYMVFFLLLLAFYQASERIYTAVITPIWWIVAIYSILFVGMTYLYQIPTIYDPLTNSTSNTTLLDIGLKKFETAELFLNMWTPVIALVIVVLQLKYFHRPARESRARKIKESREKRQEETRVHQRVSSPSSFEMVDNGEEVEGQLEEKRPCSDYWWLFWKMLRDAFTWFFNLVFRILELHLPKGLLLCILAVAISEVGAVDIFPVFLLCLFVPYSNLPKLFYFVIMVWTSLTIVLKMFYQLQFVKTDELSFNCTVEGANHPSNFSVSFKEDEVSSTITANESVTAAWAGLEKVDSISHYIGGYIVIVVLIALAVTMFRRQKRVKEEKQSDGEPVPHEGCIFLDGKRSDLDQSFAAAFKFLVNHFFELTGITICFIATAIVIACRSDAYAVVYLLFLSIMVVARSGGAFLRCFWPVFVIVLAISVFVQFAMVVGLPSSLCFLISNNYPWFTPSSSRKGLLVWLFLPVDSHLGSLDMKTQNKWFIMGDFVLLLLYSWQWDLFRQKNENENDEIFDGTSEPYTIPDFTLGSSKDGKSKRLLDGLKLFTFKYFIWVTLLVVFLAGVSRISILSLGYIFGCFYFLWQGQEQLRFRPNKLLQRWGYSLFYNYFVMLIKVGFQLWACVYKVPCTVSLLFNVVCFRQDFYRDVGLSPESCSSENQENATEPSNVGLVYDVLVFGFLLAQLRIFRSPYFELVRAEMDWFAKKSTRQEAARLVDEATFEMRSEQQQKDEEAKQELLESAEKLRERGFLSAGKSMKERLLEFQSDSQFLYGGTLLPEGENLAKDEQSTTEEEGEDDVDEQAGDKEAEVMETAKMDRSSDLSAVESIWLAVLESMNSLTGWLKGASASYQYVYRKLQKDRKKEVQHRTSLQLMDRLHDSEMESSGRVLSPTRQPREPKGFLDKLLRRDDDDDDVRREALLRKELGKSVFSSAKPFIRLLSALYWAFLARTDLLCHLVMIINFILTGSTLSLVLPILVFFWGLLSNPRPSKTFWVVVIVYMEIIILVQYVLQSRLIPLTDKTTSDPYKWSEYVGIQQVSNFTMKAMADFVVLWIVSFHVTNLQLQGLWLGSGERKETDKEKTPQVTDVGSPASPVRSQSPLSREDEDANCCVRAFESLKNFIKMTLDRNTGTGFRDYYTVMVFFDVISYVILIFGWSSFGEASSHNVANFFHRNYNYVPVPFLVMLLIQFVSFLVDRALYVRGWTVGKYVYNILVVILIHIWVFLILPLVTNRSFTNNPVVQVWYFFKCVYMALSAAQVAAGFPSQRSGHWLMNVKTYPSLNGWAMQGLLLIPFLTELRELMDWCFTKTTLEMTLWFKVQDIWHEAYITKCRRKRESRRPRTLGTSQPNLTKGFLGGIFILFIVLIIWFPLLFISLINSSSVANTPREVTVELTLAGYQPLFSFTAQQDKLRNLTEEEYRQLEATYTTADQKALLDRYSRVDVTRVLIPGNSSSLWTITPPARDLLQTTLDSNSSLNMEFTWSIVRNPPTGLTARTVTGSINIVLDDGERELRNGIARVLNGENSSVSIPSLFPTVVSGPANGRSKGLSSFKDIPGFLVNVSLFRVEDVPLGGIFLKEWWNLQNQSHHFLGDTTGLEMVIFSEPVVPPEFSFLSGLSVIGLYISIVLVIGQFLKGHFRGISHRIIYEDMEDPQAIMNLCQNVFRVRALAAETEDVRESQKYLQLEETLVGELFVLYRSPEKILETTRMKENID
eukprot:m.299204 g.299204  ORF g.299204 m.299204 type:complete len:2308 (+) comp40787_c0_seq2:130-7053(+)